MARRNWLLALPPLLFLAFAALAWLGLRREAPDELPSALVGQPAPTLAQLGALADNPVPTDADLKAPGVKLVNFFASWCAPFRVEHPFLVAMAESPAVKQGKVALVGFNYKDEAENARRFLGALGNPYSAVGVDRAGRAAIDWGVYGVPETFLIGPDGRILEKHVGPLDGAAASRMLARAQKGS